MAPISLSSSNPIQTPTRRSISPSSPLPHKWDKWSPQSRHPHPPRNHHPTPSHPPPCSLPNHPANLSTSIPPLRRLMGTHLPHSLRPTSLHLTSISRETVSPLYLRLQYHRNVFGPRDGAFYSQLSIPSSLLSKWQSLLLV
jgi:hypothetical protein